MHITFADGATSQTVDHLLFGTGYQVDITRYPFLTAALTARIRRAGGYPLLRRGMESSVPGLHFLGAPAAWSFGPIMRFVCGSWYTGRALVRSHRRPGPAAWGRRASARGRQSRRAVVTSTTSRAAQRAGPSPADPGVGAVVIGGGCQGLGIARSLGRYGIPVCVVDDEISRCSCVAICPRRHPCPRPAY